MKWIKAFFKSWASFWLEIYALLSLCDSVTTFNGYIVTICLLIFCMESHKQIFRKLIG